MKGTLASVVDLALEDEGLRELSERLSKGASPSESPAARSATAVPASSPLRPILVAALAAEQEAYGARPMLVVTPDDRSARDFAAALAFYVRDRAVRYYPSRGIGYSSHVSPPPHLVGLRIDALDSLLEAQPGSPGTVERAPIVVAGAVALAETVPDASLRPHGFTIATGEEIDLTETASRLAAAGYERVDQVTERGQFAMRGGILDVFAATEERAARIELFGDEVESMRWFSTFTQRSLGEAGELDIAPAAELDVEHRELAELAELALMEAEEAAQAAGTNAAGAKVDGAEGDGGSANGATPTAVPQPRLGEVLPIDSFHAPLDLIPATTAIVLTAPEEIEPTLNDHWEDVTLSIHDEDARSLYVDVAGPLQARAALQFVNSGSVEGTDGPLEFRAARAESPARNMREAEAELDKLVRSGYRVVVAFEGAGEAERARYNLDRLEARLLGAGDVVAPRPGLSFAEARLAEGVIWPGPRLAIYPIRRLVHRTARRPEPALGSGRARLAFTDLRVGDYVVHEDHGVARFAGFETREVAGITRDYLYLEYKGEDRVYVPTEQLAKLSRYVGAGDAPTLSALGGKRWQNLKARARRAATEMAGELINLYAERRTRKGHAFSPDSEWQIQMESAFPYRETADQMDAIEAVKTDMEAERPMDRLVCGDVGYGKTEVALRAAVKAASDGLQTMVLVPTTILAQQHFGTFKERLADLPFVVEGVSRLRSAAEVKKTVAGFKEGKVDILIGTHRLLSRDVRAKDLGLVIVDEEQRFGVKQKDLLRQLRLRIDVLSLSATPIPRTLQMSLAGLRDISVIETPPEGRRPVRTFVGPWDEDLVRHAIEREVERGGQAFFLHNRVDSLSETAERLRGLVPAARFVEAHGQMDERELENTMLGFMRGDADVLVATTIIESGLDIPSANTLIVERSDQLGLSQAYQIRGRVGRSRERAFAYLLYPSVDLLTEEAAARLSALADHTELGSGFRIAMRDLDIRGAGNLLGDEQSGHVAAVGFELYCQMIDEAVGDLQAARAAEGEGEGAAGEPERQPVRLDVPVDAYLPADYVPFEAAKIDLHRRIAGARRRGELRAIRDELGDRFGPPPEPVENLIALQAARIDLGDAGARGIEFRGGRLSITGIKLDSAQAEAMRQAVEGLAYAWREETISVRVAGDAPARLAAVVAIATALGELLARRSEEPDRSEKTSET